MDNLSQQSDWHNYFNNNNARMYLLTNQATVPQYPSPTPTVNTPSGQCRKCGEYAAMCRKYAAKCGKYAARPKCSNCGEYAAVTKYGECSEYTARSKYGSTASAANMRQCAATMRQSAANIQQDQNAARSECVANGARSTIQW